MGNYSKNPQTAFQEALQKGYSRVRFQQGKPILDRELNLAADLGSANRFLQQYVGSGVPEGSNGFEILNVNAFTQDFTIRAGRCVVNGLEAVLANNTTYQAQPHREHLVQWPAGPSSLYLRVFTVEVNETQDADLKNTGDIGFETALRERVDWEVLVSTTAITAPDHFLLGRLDFTPGTGPAGGGDTSSTSSTTTASSISSGSTTTTTDDGGDPPSATVTDFRLRGLTLTKVRADLDILMNPARTGLKDASVLSTTIRDGAVTSQKIQDGAVTGTKFLDGSITAQKLQDNSVTGQKIQDGAVTATKIPDGSLAAQKLQDGAVTSTKLQDNSVTTQKIQNGAITGFKLANGSVGLIALNFFNLINQNTTIAPSQSVTMMVAALAFTQNTFIILNVNGAGDYTWTEKAVGGNRVVTITNLSTTATITVNVRAVSIGN